MKKTVIVLLTALLLCGCSASGSASAGKTAATAAAKASESASAQTSASASASSTAAPLKSSFDSSLVGIWEVESDLDDEGNRILMNPYMVILPDGSYSFDNFQTSGKITTDNSGKITFSNDSLLYYESVPTITDYKITGYQYQLAHMNEYPNLNTVSGEKWFLAQKYNRVDLSIMLENTSATSNKTLAYPVTLYKMGMDTAVFYTLLGGAKLNAKWTDNYGNAWEFFIDQTAKDPQPACTLTEKNGTVLHSAFINEDGEEGKEIIVFAFNEDAPDINGTIVSVDVNTVTFTQEDGSSLILTKVS